MALSPLFPTGLVTIVQLCLYILIRVMRVVLTLMKISAFPKMSNYSFMIWMMRFGGRLQGIISVMSLFVFHLPLPLLPTLCGMYREQGWVLPLHGEAGSCRLPFFASITGALFADISTTAASLGEMCGSPGWWPTFSPVCGCRRESRCWAHSL